MLPYLPAQAIVESFDGEQTDADRKANSVHDHCLSSSIDSAKLFDQALTSFTCDDCTSVTPDIINKETLAAQVKKETKPFSSEYLLLLLFFLLFFL